MEETKPKHDPAVLELLAAQSKKRVRLNEWQKAWAILHGMPLRGRGRPRKLLRPDYHKPRPDATGAVLTPRRATP